MLLQRWRIGGMLATHCCYQLLQDVWRYCCALVVMLLLLQLLAAASTA
jgi:hypothetical protein